MSEENMQSDPRFGKRITDHLPLPLQQERSQMEKHFVTVIVAIILGVLGWVAFKVTVLAEVTAGMTVHQQNLKQNIHDIKEELRGDIREIKNGLTLATRDRFTATEAKEVHSACRERIASIEKRVELLERDHIKAGLKSAAPTY